MDGLEELNVLVEASLHEGLSAYKGKVPASLVLVKTLSTGIFGFILSFFCTFQLYFGCCMALAGEC